LGTIHSHNAYLHLKNVGISFGNINYIYKQNYTMGKQDELKTISVFLDEAAEYGLEVEVIYTALKNMQEDPNLTPAQAMQFGMEEWVK